MGERARALDAGGVTLPACRLCAAPLARILVDLGAMPLANTLLTPAQAAAGADRAFPLVVRVCEGCWLVQADAVAAPEAIFADYAYFSSISTSWVEQARRYATDMIQRLNLGANARVIEVASNDGYLLQHFVAAGIPVLGIEPAANVAAVARARGVPTETLFLGRDSGRTLAARGVAADLIVANNVLAHVPDPAGFAAGIAALLKPGGVATFEFPHLLRLLRGAQFDTIYHEHFSYLSLLTVERVLRGSGLRAFDVQPLSTHGGSLRVFACHAAASRAEEPGLAAVRAEEAAAGLDRPETYDNFAPRVAHVCRGFRSFLDAGRRNSRRIAAYGAAAKGVTLLNACAVGPTDLLFVADRSPAKQGRLLPGCRLPVVSPEALRAARPDDVVILPWNLADEITAELAPLRDGGARFWVAVPDMAAV